MSSEDVLNVKSVGKAFRILECFGETGATEKDLSLMDIVRLTGYAKSAVQRFTHTLQLAGYLEKNPNTRRYSLTVKTVEIAFNFLRNNSFIEMANPHLIDLCRATDQRVSLSLLDDTSLVFVMRHQTKPDYFYSSLVGRRIPACANGGGRAVLALLDEESRLDIVERSELIPYTARSITDKARILEEIEKIGRLGYGLTSEQVTYGELGIGAAVTSKSGYPFATLHIIGSLSEFDPETFEKRFLTPFLETLQRISGR